MDEEEASKKVELKGSEHTEILFTGKCKVLHKRFQKLPKNDDDQDKDSAPAGEWTGGVTGTFTVRKDKRSSVHWLQVNSQQVSGRHSCLGCKTATHQT